MKAKQEVIIIGSGMAGLSAGSLLATKGYKVTVLEANYLPGGCTGSYWRKGFIFEAGATTLVGLDDKAPLHYLLKQTGVKLEGVRKLSLPMQVRLANGSTINRFHNLNDWIAHAEEVFGKKNQKRFWKFCFAVSRFVWETSTKQRFFPPEKPADLWKAIKNLHWKQPIFALLSLFSTAQLLKWFKLNDNKAFVDFVNQQLIITAQSPAEDTNILFGAAALCYTNDGNYYIDGGLNNLVQPFVEDIISKGGQVLFRHSVKKVLAHPDGGYEVQTEKQGSFFAPLVMFAIPANNVVELTPTVLKRPPALMQAKDLASALQIGIGFKTERSFEALHYQIHLEKPIESLGTQGPKSIFLSLSHPEDRNRTEEATLRVASISGHLHRPDVSQVYDKQAIVNEVLKVLEKEGFIYPNEIVYLHCSLSKEWQQWTKRAFGFVGGYPQKMKIKPWQMNGHRLSAKGLYHCGDSTYPGQGIPGVVLSGIIAAEKLMADFPLSK